MQKEIRRVDEMQRMELCGRCVDVMRERNLIRMVSRPVSCRIYCECCKDLRYGGIYDVRPKKQKERRDDEHGSGVDFARGAGSVEAVGGEEVHDGGSTVETAEGGSSCQSVGL